MNNKKQYIENMIERYNKRHYMSRIALTEWSPGDGWTRYSLSDETGSRRYSDNFTLSEMYAFMSGLIAEMDGLTSR